MLERARQPHAGQRDAPSGRTESQRAQVRPSDVLLRPIRRHRSTGGGGVAIAATALAFALAADDERIRVTVDGDGFTQ